MTAIGTITTATTAIRAVRSTSASAWQRTRHVVPAIATLTWSTSATCDTRRGWNIRGRIEVDGQRGYRDQRRGYRGYNNGSDRGSFKCEIRRGRVVDIDYNGIRGLNRL